MNKKENGNFMDGQAVNFSEDFEREHLKESVYLQAAQAEKEQRIMREINEEENRLPAKITLLTPVHNHDESKVNPLPF